MFSALLYLQCLQTGNRLLARLRRLRQPKYLLGALVGGLYLYFNFFRYLLFNRSFRARGWGGAASAAGTFVVAGSVLASGLETLGALFLFALSLFAWLLPNRRAALVFSEAEIAFLFPAPISRRALIHFRLLRSQLGILFSIVIITLITGRLRAAGWESALHQSVGWWILLSTFSLHGLALSFARSLLLERGVSNWRRRTFTLVVAAALLGAGLFWVSRTLPGFDLFDLPPTAGHDAAAFREFLISRLGVLDAALRSPPLGWILWPFRVPLRPFLAADTHAFLLTLGPALGLLAIHYAWIMRAEVAFEEASLEVSRRHAERLASLRAGKGVRTRAIGARRDPFRLRSGGMRLTAIVWKNLLAAGPLFNVRLLVVALGFFAAVLALAFSGWLPAAWLTRKAALAPVAGAIVLEFFVMVLLFGSQMVRNDLRQDLANVELLKTYPLPGWQIVLGELLGPTLLLTALQWLLLLVMLTLFSGSFHSAGRIFGIVPQLPWALAVALLAPPFNFLSLTIPNAAVLLLPAWFQSGPHAPHGVEVMGQRLIFFFGQFFILAVTLVPAAGAGLAVYFAARFLGGSFALTTILAPLAAAAVLVGEGVLALVPLGHWFEQLDMSAENESR